MGLRATNRCAYGRLIWPYPGVRASVLDALTGAYQANTDRLPRADRERRATKKLQPLGLEPQRRGYRESRSSATESIDNSSVGGCLPESA